MKVLVAVVFFSLASLLPLAVSKDERKDPEFTNEDLVDFLKEQENAGREGFNEKDEKWYPHGSPEGGSKTIGYGHKIQAGEEAKFEDGLTEDEVNDLLNSDIDAARTKAKDFVTKEHGPDAWDCLSDIQKAAATEIQFNVKGGLSTFPKFTEALVNDDIEGMRAEHERSFTDPETGEKKPLKKRNDAFEKTFITPQCPEASAHPDPHFETWGGNTFDFHGVCDLVFLQSSVFGEGKGLHVHMRTKHAIDGEMHHWSTISDVAIKIGDDVLEISEDGTWSVNGEAGGTPPIVLAEKYAVTVESESKQNKDQINYYIDLGSKQSITVTLWEGLMALNIKGYYTREDFHDMVGLIGTFDQPDKLIGRDGVTDYSDRWDEFGEQWQVQGNSLFAITPSDHPQYPDPCVPANKMERRRLFRQDRVLHRRATEACAHLDGPKSDNCIFDIAVTGDISWADAPWYEQ